mmetsp:Transcript_13223/g.24331  ORF Transcript_13223/g.24331 Transcript_13223/m.24331 type:complete len:91 (-) Transcript_13223:105-377(-)
MLWIIAIIKDDNWGDFSLTDEDVVEEAIENDTPNYSVMGVFSLLLTIANVLMVACGATLMFRLKEVLPVKKKVFWDDLKTARRIYTVRKK